MAAAADDDSAECYRRRAAESAEWMRLRLRSAAERDRLFVGLLRARIERKTERDALATQSLRDDAAEALAELRANSGHAADAVARAKRELDAFANAFRADGCCGGGGGTADAMAAENARLAEVARLRRERLHDSLALVRSAECELNRKRDEIDRMRSDVISACERNRTTTTGVGADHTS